MSLQVRKKYPIPRTTKPHVTLPQRTLKREQRRATYQRMTSTMLVLLVLAVGSGMLYTWYVGQQKTASASQAPPTPSVRPILKPNKIASDAPIGVATQSATTDVARGGNASISIRTNPEAECTIGVKYGTVPANDSGLAAKLADEFGLASWAWTVAAGVPTGKWPVTVTCKNKKNSAVVVADLIVK